jgi:hypothetical protein
LKERGKERGIVTVLNACLSVLLASTFTFSFSPSPLTASPFITIHKFRQYGPHIKLVDSINDSTEVAIQKMIEGIQRMIRVSNNNNNNNNDDSQQEPEVRISSATKRHFELEI